MATQLVPLPEVERLSAVVIRILGGNPGKVSISALALRQSPIDTHQFTLQGEITVRPAVRQPCH